MSRMRRLPTRILFQLILHVVTIVASAILVVIIPVVPMFIVSFLALPRHEVFSGPLMKFKHCVMRKTTAERQ